MNFYLSESRSLRIGSFALFYVAQGLPIGLISIALPAWLAGQAASASEIAYFVAISGLPWGFKLLVGPVMDRFAYLPMGRRRPWIIVAQGGLLLSICLLGLVSDPVSNIELLTWLAFIVNSFAAVQDVAVDGMAIDVLPEEERGKANAFMAFGQVAGFSGSAAACGFALVHFGLEGAAAVLVVGVAFVFVFGVVVRERLGEKLVPWTEGRASKSAIANQAKDWRSIMLDLFKVLFLPASLLLFLMALFWRIQAGFWVSAVPVIAVNELGFASENYSNYAAIVGFMAALFGLAFGPLIDRSGSRNLLLIGLLAMGCLHVSAGLMTSLWGQTWFQLLIFVGDQFVGQIVFICFIALHMKVCWEKVAATQFAIYMAWSNLARSIGAGIYGEVQPMLVMGQEFLIMGISAFFAAGILAMVNFKVHQQRLVDLRAIPPGLKLAD